MISRVLRTILEAPAISRSPTVFARENSVQGGACRDEGKIPRGVLMIIPVKNIHTNSGVVSGVNVKRHDFGPPPYKNPCNAGRARKRIQSPLLFALLSRQYLQPYRQGDYSGNEFLRPKILHPCESIKGRGVGVICQPPSRCTKHMRE